VHRYVKLRADDEFGVMTSRRKLSARSKRQPPLLAAFLNKRPRFSMAENGNLIQTSDLSDSDCDAVRLGKRNWIDQTEYLRLIVQSLNDLGFHHIATQLEADAQIKHEEQNVVELRKAVLCGDWDRALELLDSIPLEEEFTRKRAQFLLVEEKFLEAVEKREWKTALRYLRGELAPLNVNVTRLHLLASCLLCPTGDDLKKVAEWDGPTEEARNKVLLSLQDIVPPHVMLPHSRLVCLIEQALQSQMDNCAYHNTAHASPSLFVDYSVGMEQIPTEVIHELCDHTDEVWHVQFSNDGKSLASCSLDGISVIWELRSRDDVRKKLELAEHTAPVSYLAWSPNDQYLATTSQDKTLKVWDTTTGKCIQTISDHSDHVTSMGWMPDSKRFISGSSDSFLYMWNLDGKKLRSWNTARVHDLVVSKAGDRLITIGNDKKIKIFDLEGSYDMGTIDCDKAVSAITLSSDGLNLLASTQSRQIQLWELNPDLKGPQPTKPRRVYKLPDLVTEDQKYIIRTCFGGHSEAFILSGSEECKVYVWHKKSGKLITALEGHSGLVNSVSWNPVDPTMFASASDDKSVQIWGIKYPSTARW